MSGQARLVYVKNMNRNIPPREGEPAGTNTITAIMLMIMGVGGAGGDKGR